MSATADVEAYLARMRPQAGQSVDSFARSGLAWQAEIYSANAGGDIQGLGWWEISPQAREGWREWAREKFKEAGIATGANHGDAP